MARERRAVAGRRVAASVVVLVLAGMLSACGIPADPDGSLERIEGGELRVGASAQDGLVEVSGQDASGVDASGPLPALVEGFARELDADVVWTSGSEERLVDDLEGGELDLVIGGMTDATPWADRVSVTRGYPGIDASGSSIVVLLPMGENGLQAALERYLDREAG